MSRICEGRVVIVGRAAAAVLAEAEDTLHVLLVAPRAHRIQVASETWSLSAEEAEQLLDDKDQNRERYYREYYDREWQDATNYDLTLNTARLGYEGAADLIVARARSLGW